MKKHLITLILGILMPFFPAMAQKNSLTLKMENVTISQVLLAIEKETGYIFIYKSDDLKLSELVSVDERNARVEDVLEKALKGKASFSISGRQIVLKGIASDSDRRSVRISGRVIDKSGPLPGVSVIEKGTSNATITDVEGNYSLTVANSSGVLVFNSLGYVEQTADIGGRSVLDVTLVEESLALDEIVVVGYGVQKKVNLTGAVVVVDGEKLTSRNATNVGDMLKGFMPNVNITSTGRAGDTPSINIRGVTSIASGTGPLVLVDGVETNIMDVNSADVESISVLKDASAAAVYGSRAGFGVVLITTKTGASEKLRVTYNGKFSFGNSTVSTDYETRGYYSAYIADTFFRTYQGTNYTTYIDEDYHELWIRRNDVVEDPSRPWVVEKNGEYKYYANFDWYRYLYDNFRPTHQHDFSVQGGTDKVNFMFSGAYYNQKGAVAICPDHYVHYNFRSKVSARITDWLTLSNNTAYSNRNQKFPGMSSSAGNYFSSGWSHALACIVPINPDGTMVYKSSVNPTYDVTDGVHAIAQYGKHDMYDNNAELRTTFELTVAPLKQFEIKANYSFTDNMFHAFNRFVDIPYSTIPGKETMMSTSTSAAEDKIQESFNTTRRHVANAYATYSDTFADKHHFSAMLGFNYEYKYYKSNYMRRYNLLSEDISDFNIAVGDNIYTRGGQNAYAIMGFFYRVNYNYDERYLLEVSGRYDGSSRFAKGHRFGFFPSFSAGWRISEEKFFASAKDYVNNLKLRVSYGALGNQAAVGYYDYIQTISTSSQLNYAFGDNKKVYYASVSAPNSDDISWEKIYTTNVGIDLSMFRGCFNFSIDGFIRDTRDMIMQSQALPAGYGADAPKANSADLRTYGFELSLSYNNRFMLVGDDFHYGVSFCLGDSQSVVTRYDNPSKNLASPYVGKRLGDIWGYKVDGFFASDEEAAGWGVDQSIVNNMINTEVVDQGLHAGDLKFVDLDDNGVIEETTSADDIKDMTIIGNCLPRFNYSVGATLNWKGIDLSILFQGVAKQNWYPGGNALSFWGPYARPYVSFVAKDFMSHVWSEDNPDAYFPRPRGYVALFNNRELGAVNDRYLQNVGYCRLKNFTLGYSLPKKVINKAKLEKVRFYVSGENLLTFSPLHSRYIDPEQVSTSLSWSNCRGTGLTYPYARTVTFGIDITL